MEFFMVFIAASNVEGIDTMKGKLMLAWYMVSERTNYTCSGAIRNRQFQQSVSEKQYCFSESTVRVVAP